MKAKVVNEQLVAMCVGNSVFYTLPIQSFEGYFATTDGHILSAISGRSVTGSSAMYEPIKLKARDSNGYLIVDLSQAGSMVTRRVHRLIASTFLVAPDNYIHKDYSEKERSQVNHIDGDKHNNALSNLEWVSASENIQHYYKYLKAS